MSDNLDDIGRMDGGGSPLDVPVSEFGSVFERIPRRTVSLLDWVQSEDHRPKVERVRAASSKEERDQLKKNLPLITPSGIFSERKNEELVQHSGLLCFDVDAKDNEHLSNFDALKEEIAKVRQVAYCGRSASGQGFFLLVPIAFPDHHRAQFQAFKAYLERFGLIVDSTPDPCRLRAASYDPEPFIRHDAPPFRGLPIPKRPRTTAPKGDRGSDLDKLERLIGEIERTGTDITASYEAWQQIAAAIANIAGDEGESLFHRVSCFHPDYKERETSTKFRNRLKSPGSYGLGTVLHYASLEGIRLKEAREPP